MAEIERYKAENAQLKHEKCKAEANTKRERCEKEIVTEERDGLRLANKALLYQLKEAKRAGDKRSADHLVELPDRPAKLTYKA